MPAILMPIMPAAPPLCTCAASDLRAASLPGGEGAFARAEVARAARLLPGPAPAALYPNTNCKARRAPVSRGGFIQAPSGFAGSGSRGGPPAPPPFRALPTGPCPACWLGFASGAYYKGPSINMK